MSEQKNSVVFPLIVIGFILRASGALNPIHEIMHMITVEALGGFVTKLEWSRVWWNGIPEHLYPIVHGSAYWLELVLYSGIILVRRERACIPYGVLIGVFVRGMISEDFDRIGSAGNYLIFFLVAVGLIVWADGLISPSRTKTKSVAQQIKA